MGQWNIDEKHLKVSSWKWISFWDIPETHQKERPGTSLDSVNFEPFLFPGWLIPDNNFSIRNTKSSSFHLWFYIITNKFGLLRDILLLGMKSNLSYFLKVTRNRKMITYNFITQRKLWMTLKYIFLAFSYEILKDWAHTAYTTLWHAFWTFHHALVYH